MDISPYCPSSWFRPTYVLLPKGETVVKKWKMTIEDVLDSDEKCCLEVELSEDLEKAFLKAHRLKRFNNSLFKEWFKGILWRALVSLEKGGYDTIYERGTKSTKDKGDLKDIQVGDIVSFWKERAGQSYGQHTREIAAIRSGVLVTEPLYESDPAQKVSYRSVTRAIRKA